MKRLKLTKVITCTLIMISIIALNPLKASAEWKQDNEGWWYSENNSWAKGWKQIDGNWYFFTDDGYMAHDILFEEYRNESGKLAYGTNYQKNKVYQESDLSKDSIEKLNSIITNEYYLNKNGVLTEIITSGKFKIDKSTGTIVGYVDEGNETSLVIPSKIDNIDIKSIGDDAFNSCSNLQNIKIPNSVTSIGNSAFAYCKGIRSIAIPDSVKSIGNGSFMACTNLQDITIPNSVTSIDARAFMDCKSLKSIVIPDSVTVINDITFGSCDNLQNVTIPNSVTSIGFGAFEFCYNLTNINSNQKNIDIVKKQIGK